MLEGFYLELARRGAQARAGQDADVDLVMRDAAEALLALVDFCEMRRRGSSRPIY